MRSEIKIKDCKELVENKVTLLDALQSKELIDMVLSNACVLNITLDDNDMTDWGHGYWMGVLKTLNWVLGEHNDFYESLIAIRHRKKDDYIDSRLEAIAAEREIYNYETLDELTAKLNIRNSKRELLKRPSAINRKLQEMEKPFEIKITENKQRHKQYQLIYTGQD